MHAASDEPAEYRHLFAPFERGRLRLKNRVVHASMTTRYVGDSRVTDELIAYSENRARGGAALIVSEPVNGTHFQARPHYVRAWNDDEIDGLARWAAAVEQHDCRFIGQLQDSGRGRHERGRNPFAIGASPLPDDLSWTVPRVLTTAEVAGIVDEFAATARRFERCGFSGVELSCGHGHLFHQFMSPWSNRREDRYGGDFEGRLRFVRELVAAIRANVKREFVLGLKLPGDDGIPGGIDEALAARIADALTTGDDVDYVAFCQGAHANTLDWHIPDMHWPRLAWLPLTKRLRAHVNGKPVMALGLVTDPAEAEGIVARGDAELVAVGRALITDPAWPRKARQGRAGDIRYCVSCNTCWGSIAGPGRLVCDNNPRLGQRDEVDWQPPRVSRAKRVVVVGGGVASLEAAWLAAARGHAVTLFGASAEVGGKTRLHAELPGGESLSSVYDWQYVAARRAGVRFELGVRASADDVLALAPDVVVLGTGSSMTWPERLPLEWHTEGWVPDLRRLALDLRGTHARQGGTAVIFDADHTEGTYAMAERLHRLYDRVVLVTPRERFAADVPLVSALGAFRRLSKLGIELLPFAEIAPTSPLEEGVVQAANVYSGEVREIRDVALLAISTPRAPDDALAVPLREAGYEVHAIGDCSVPRTLLSATADGYRVGAAI